MKLIVGLGNPGTQYTRTRHNAGFLVVDRLAAKYGDGGVPKTRFQSVALDASIEGEKCLLLKPTTFMNRSGQAVGEAVAFFKLDPYQDLLVVVDDLYLPVGAVRLRPGGGTGGHNGLSDIQRALGGDMYPRLRVGVGMLPDGGKPPEFNQADFVLSRFSDDDEPLFDSGVASASLGAALWVGKGLSAAMNSINAPKPGEKGTDAKK
ncbi:MAG: aminoacyl-tRNA hydrolase [Tepidisphaera sp.]|nr:aminoacyl-tRNA hydrolase [Tepidisphaera sp.]